MIWLRRKFILKLHMRDGARHRVICQDFQTGRRDGNTLSSIKVIGGKLPDYVRLDEISAITSRRSWLRWYIG